MTEPAGLLGGLTVATFLERHWQKRSLLVRGAIPGFTTPVTPDELQTLALSPGLRSRLVTTPAPGSTAEIRHGPFGTADFATLPESGWTLLVQEVDRRIPALGALLERFRFVPNWRIDDVMVSYARDAGGIGPHADRYDVFLLQAYGRKRWRIVEADTTVEWELTPGDLLYLPPGVPHDGVAVGDCMTCSIGFRAPDPRDLYSSFLTQLGPEVFADLRYTDPDLAPVVNVGEIAPAARRQLRESASRLFAADGEFDRWIGRYVTRPHRGSHAPEGGRCTVAELRELLAAGGFLARSAPSHFAWLREADGDVVLFGGGEAYVLGPGTEAVAERIAGVSRLDGAGLAELLEDDRHVGILFDLILRGFLAPLSV